MSELSPITNIFREPRHDLDPDTDAFLRAFVPDYVTGETVKPEEPKQEQAEIVAQENPDLKQFSNQEERDKYNEGLEELNGVIIKRGELENLRNLFKRINEDLRIAGLNEIELGEGEYEIARDSLAGNIDINDLGEVRRIWLDNLFIQSIGDFSMFKSLKVLSFSNTQVVSLDNTLLPDSLESLHADDTKIDSLDNANFPLILSQLTLSRTPFSHDRDAVNRLKERLIGCEVETDEFE